MKIYQFTNQQLREEIKQFGKTTYGKITFLLAYTLPFLFLLCMLIVAVGMKVGTFSPFLTCFLFVVLLFGVWITLITFLLGSRYYYREFKGFLDSKK